MVLVLLLVKWYWLTGGCERFEEMILNVTFDIPHLNLLVL
jgi:hypothetical protein